MFQDWDHILTFLEKAITKIWNEYMSYGNTETQKINLHCLICLELVVTDHFSPGHCTNDDALQNDNTWTEGDDSVTRKGSIDFLK